MPRGLLLTRTHTSRGRVGVVDNTVAEGNHLWNWNGTYPYPHPKTVEPYLIGVLGSDQDPQPCEPYPHGAKGPCTPSAPAAWQGPINQLVAIQRNRLLNNAGIVVRGHTARAAPNPGRHHSRPQGRGRSACSTGAGPAALTP